MTLKTPLKRSIKRIIDSFKHATEGVMDAFRSQKHMRVHFVIIVVVAVLSCFFRLSVSEVAVLIVCIALVIVAELVNTAVESILNLVVQTYHPGAKFAKDVAAGAVLVAALNAAVVGFYIFFREERLTSLWEDRWQPWTMDDPVHLGAVSVVLVLVLIVVSKVWRKRGSVLRGGNVSGHTALAFCLSTCLFFLTRNVLVTLIGVVLAGMVAQSRLEGGMHTWRGLVYGTLLGVLTTLLVFVVLSWGQVF
jgi:diacylglycerol kinase (ATP)